MVVSQDSVVLGGTHDKDRWDTAPTAQVTKFILQGCVALEPSLKVEYISSIESPK